MSEKPKHLYVVTEHAHYEVGTTAYEKPQTRSWELARSRYTLTEGAEWDALVERARVIVANCEESAFEQAFLAYFGEAP